MPLPFLTAGRVIDDALAAEPEALPEEDRDRWRRPYRPGPWRVGGTAVLLLLTSYVLFSAMIIALAGSLPGAGVCAAVGVLVIVFVVRVLGMGIRVSARGVRQTGLFSSTTLGWHEIAEVRTAQQPVKWLGTPRSVQGQALIITPVGGTRLKTVVTDHNADFLGRPEAFEMATDTIEGWAALYGR